MFKNKKNNEFQKMLLRRKLLLWKRMNLEIIKINLNLI
jgi:hypothetical protein